MAIEAKIDFRQRTIGLGQRLVARHPLDLPRLVKVIDAQRQGAQTVTITPEKNSSSNMIVSISTNSSTGSTKLKGFDNIAGQLGKAGVKSVTITAEEFAHGTVARNLRGLMTYNALKLAKMYGNGQQQDETIALADKRESANKANWVTFGGISSGLLLWASGVNPLLALSAGTYLGIALRSEYRSIHHLFS